MSYLYMRCFFEVLERVNLGITFITEADREY